MGVYAVGIRTSICVPVESLETGWRPIITHEASVSYRTLRWDRPEDGAARKAGDTLGVFVPIVFFLPLPPYQ